MSGTYCWGQDLAGLNLTARLFVRPDLYGCCLGLTSRSTTDRMHVGSASCSPGITPDCASSVCNTRPDPFVNGLVGTVDQCFAFMLVRSLWNTAAGDSRICRGNGFHRHAP